MLWQKAVEQRAQAAQVIPVAWPTGGGKVITSKSIWGIGPHPNSADFGTNRQSASFIDDIKTLDLSRESGFLDVPLGRRTYGRLEISNKAVSADGLTKELKINYTLGDKEVVFNQKYDATNSSEIKQMVKETRQAIKDYCIKSQIKDGAKVVYFARGGNWLDVASGKMHRGRK